MTSPSTPRVASGIGDLRVGQVVIRKVIGQWRNPVTLDQRDIQDDAYASSADLVLILEDIPPEPLFLSPKAQKLVDHLEREIAAFDIATDNWWRVIAAARALVEEVRNQ